tara:strand:+ start:129 stop:482 length:354 start_codon:yes stop_codon:yes gene_type:complete
MCYSVSILKKGIDFNKLNVPSWDKGVRMTIKLFWENSNPVPARTTKTLKSSWNFVPDAERKQTVSMYPIMITGAMGLGMRDYLKAKRDEYRREVLAKAKLFIDNKRMSQVGTQTEEK